MSKTFEELVQLKQDGKIGWVEFLKQSDFAEDYQAWLDGRGEKPTEDNAELWYDMTDTSLMDGQDNNDYNYE